MPTKIVIKKNTYFDSVSLMSVSTKANKLPGVEQAFVAMAYRAPAFRNLAQPTAEDKDALALLVLSAVLAVWEQIGDLFESGIKRHFRLMNGTRKPILYAIGCFAGFYIL